MIAGARHAALLAALSLLGLAATAGAAAAAPANDDRSTPAPLGALPAQVGGTLVGATRVATDPPSSCTAAGPQVWYRFVAPADGRVAARLVAAGDLDAVVDAYLSERSQTRPLACDVTDATGVGALDFQVKKGQAYLIAVSRLPNSVAGTFDLTVVAPQPPPKPPGRALPRGGADGTLDRVGNVQDAYAVRLRQGRTYRLRLSGRGDRPCRIGAALYAPGIDSFDSAAVKRFGCDDDGYATVTPGPGEGGRYSVLVTVAPGVRTLQRYHLEEAGAGRDDTAPGLFLANRATARGALNGARIDALDLYRFSVAKRSDLKLALTTGDDNAFELRLLNDRGRQVQCACGEEGDAELRRQLAPGRYFLAVRSIDRSAGAYRLRRISRVLTRTSVGFDAKRAGVGTTTPINVSVRPQVSGPATIVIERFDPLSGWLFSRIVHTHVSAGRGSIGFLPPTVGRWRAHASFDGTVGSGSSESGYAQLLVVAGAG